MNTNFKIYQECFIEKYSLLFKYYREKRNLKRRELEVLTALPFEIWDELRYKIPDTERYKGYKEVLNEIKKIEKQMREIKTNLSGFTQNNYKHIELINQVLKHISYANRELNQKYRAKLEENEENWEERIC